MVGPTCFSGPSARLVPVFAGLVLVFGVGVPEVRGAGVRPAGVSLTGARGAGVFEVFEVREAGVRRAGFAVAGVSAGSGRDDSVLA
jgi:hypothetical protein